MKSISFIISAFVFFTMCACNEHDDNVVALVPDGNDSIPSDTLPIDSGEITDSIKPIFYYISPQKPFPQHTQYHPGVILPNVNQAQMDETVITFYKQWRNRYLKAINDTQYYVYYTKEYKVGKAISCSEGHGFGMVITALMAGVDSSSYDDFIKLYNFYDTHRSAMNHNLMAWQQDENGKNSSGADSATDGDLDIAFALLLAHKQWGSNGKVDFIAAAKKVIDAIYKSDISSTYKTIELGDWVNSGKYAKSTRFCDFMIDHIRTFSNFTGNSEWMEVVDTAYQLVNSVAHKTTGLYPDFAIRTDSGFVACEANFLEGQHDGDYYYNSCRAPWRISMDYIVNGDDRAKQTLQRLNIWLSDNTNGNASNICGGYYLDGRPIYQWSDMAFTAPFGVCAMIDASNQVWLNKMWQQINAEKISSGAYFGNSIKMLCLITMSGNWWSAY